jgi:hypothetical protein
MRPARLPYSGGVTESTIHFLTNSSKITREFNVGR